MLEVIEAGLFSTVQDGGRAGWGHLGVRQAGAADPVALAAANLLVGAPADAPAVEMTLLGGRFVVQHDTLVGIAGADMGATVSEEDRPLAPGGSYRLRAGTTLAFGPAVDGARTYLALAGGLGLPPVLGAVSTDPIAGFGGIDGRTLQAGDVLGRPGVGGAVDDIERRWPDGQPQSGISAEGHPPKVAIVAGPHFGALGAAFAAALADRMWAVSPDSDRVGLRLAGEPLEGAGSLDLVSLPMSPGAVQVPPNGLPIALMPDAPTVGGYPVPAVVARADRHRLGQLRAGDALRFSWIGLDEARRQSRAQADRLAAIAASLA